MFIPNFSSSLEFIEVLIAEKYLHNSVKECQSGLIKYELSPRYNLPINNSGLGIFAKNKFSFYYSGDQGECLNFGSGNELKISRIMNGQSAPKYSLIIDLVSGEKSSEGDLPDWLDWWKGKYSPLIPENDPLLNEFE